MKEEKYLKREIVVSGDGSHTLFLPLLNETYHSRHGAITESLYVFIEKGLKANESQNIKIFEVGFGTGLNAWLTLNELENQKVIYHTIEAYPLNKEEYSAINYYQAKEYTNGKEDYLKLHWVDWGEEHTITPSFSFKKIHQKLEDYKTQASDYDLIYYDAYGPTYQPDMWSELHFDKMYQIIFRYDTDAFTGQKLMKRPR